MRILILGGTRFIGPYLLHELHAGDHSVAVFHRGQTPIVLPTGARGFLGDRASLSDPGSEVVSTLRSFAPEVVVDMIAMTREDALATVRTFTGVARRLVVASSMDVYRPYSRLHRKEEGEPIAGLLGEDGPLRVVRYPYRGTAHAAQAGTLNFEDYEKIEVEQVVLDAPGLPGTVLRLPAVYGPNDANHRLFDPLHRMDDGRTVIALPETYAQWRWTQDYVENVAHGIALAATDERASGRTYNVGPTYTPTTQERFEVLGRAVGWNGRVVVLSDDALPPFDGGSVDLRHHLACDTGRIRRELGYADVVTPEEGLRRTAEWERAHPPSSVDSADFDYTAEDAAIAAAGADRSI
jgi:nucleoside-diphosphate-sugar epimerase